MYSWLEEVDPKTALRLHPNDRVRIRRALLVALSGGESITLLHGKHQHGRYDFRSLVIILMPEREALYNRINARVDQMFDGQFLEEVKHLAERYGTSCRPFLTIGYREAARYLPGIGDEAALRDTIKRETRRLAKRQMTWWRNQPRTLGWNDCTAMFREMDNSGSITDKLSRVITAFLAKSQDFSNEGIDFLVLTDLELGASA